MSACTPGRCPGSSGPIQGLLYIPCKPDCWARVSEMVPPQRVLGLLNTLDCPSGSRPGWEVSPLHGASALPLNHSHLCNGVRICSYCDWRHPKQHPNITPTTQIQDHPGGGGSGEKGHMVAFGLLHPPGETKAWIIKVTCSPSLLTTEPRNSFSPVP